MFGEGKKRCFQVSSRYTVKRMRGAFVDLVIHSGTLRYRFQEEEGRK